MRSNIKILFVSLLTSIFCLAASAQVPTPTSQLEFEEYEWDFGTIKEVDGPVSHTFKVKNTSDKPAIFERVITTCGCTTPTYPRTPIYAGKEGEITITYNPADRPGRFTKTITIITGNGKNRDVLTIKGVVTARPKTVEDEYPFLLAQDLRADKAHLSFGYVKQGSTKSMTIRLINTSNKPLTIEQEWLVKSDYLTVAVPQTIAPRKKATITLTYDLSAKTKYGLLSDQLRLKVNGKAALLPINTDGTGVDDLSKMSKKTAPLMLLSSGFVNFGKSKAGSPLNKTITITNTGASPLIIRNVQCRANSRTSLKEGDQIEAGKSMEMTVSLVPEAGETGSVFGSIVIISNDPDRPMREIRINANIE